MFEGFARETIIANGIRLNVRRAGSGPAVLLLHGYPQTHVIWHRVAPALAENFTVVWSDENTLIGIVTDRDLAIRALAEGLSPGTP